MTTEQNGAEQPKPESDQPGARMMRLGIAGMGVSCGLILVGGVLIFIGLVILLVLL